VNGGRPSGGYRGGVIVKINRPPTHACKKKNEMLARATYGKLFFQRAIISFLNLIPGYS